MKNTLAVCLLVVISILFFWQVFLKGFLPIPSDTIVGLYHPFRDLYARDYPNGIPFKNFLITDPVRQQYPWRLVSIDLLKQFKLPLWNPYTFAGTPLLGNFQSAPFYPLNALFFVAPFPLTWTALIVLQPLLGSIFLYLYLREMKIQTQASFLGAFTFGFSGFSIAWLEWNTVFHVVLWLPLILYLKERILQKFSLRLVSVFIFAEASAIFAGHLQTLFYIMLVSNAYLIARIIQLEKERTKNLCELISHSVVRYKPFLVIGAIVLLITAVQWYPTLQFIVQSARDVDQANWRQEGWFIPWSHLIQFITPDFFGNPTTLNYWGTWNYAEFVGYVGIIPLVFALYGLFFRRDKKTLFFGTFFFLSLVFALPTFFAKIPYLLNIPFLSTAQPTRLLGITDFSLAVLSALGLDYFFRYQKKTIFYPLGFVTVLLIGTWVFVLFGNQFLHITSSENILVAKRNLIFPSTIFLVTGIILALVVFFSQTTKRFSIMIYIIIVGITIFDLLRFGWKFTSFTKEEYLFPNTKVLSFLQKNLGHYRYMTTDSRIMAPNFSSIYRLQSVDGYDPLYIRQYAELIAASERGRGDISPPFGFNRIIAPHNYESRVMDLLGVRYVLSLSDLSSSKLIKVFQEGQTRVYENKKVLPKTFFVESIERVDNKQEAIERLFNRGSDISRFAVVEDSKSLRLSAFSVGVAAIAEYSENKVKVLTKNNGKGFLVFTDSYYPTWHAKIDNVKTNIYRTDYNLRGIFVPKGNHTIEFYTTLL